MAWDDDKSTAADPDNPAADEQLTAAEWDAHVADQKGHAARHEEGGADAVTDFGLIRNKQYAEVVVALSGTTPSIDLTAANLFTHTLTGNTTYTFTGAESGTYDGNTFTLLITQDGATQHTLAWPASVEWDGGSAPSTPALGEELEVTFITYDGGTTWKGRVGGRGFA